MTPFCNLFMEQPWYISVAVTWYRVRGTTGSQIPLLQIPQSRNPGSRKWIPDCNP